MKESDKWLLRKRKKADIEDKIILFYQPFSRILNLEFAGPKFLIFLGATERNRTAIICMASIGTNRCSTAAIFKCNTIIANLKIYATIFFTICIFFYFK